MNLLALLPYAAFAVAAFGWRTWSQWRRTGDTGLRLHATPGSVQWSAKLAFIAALAAGVAGPVVGLFGLDPLSVLDNESIRLIGLVLACLGVLATLAAQCTIRANDQPGS